MKKGMNDEREKKFGSFVYSGGVSLVCFGKQLKEERNEDEICNETQVPPKSTIHKARSDQISAKDFPQSFSNLEFELQGKQ